MGSNNLAQRKEKPHATPFRLLQNAGQPLDQLQVLRPDEADQNTLEPEDQEALQELGRCSDFRSEGPEIDLKGDQGERFCLSERIGKKNVVLVFGAIT